MAGADAQLLTANEAVVRTAFDAINRHDVEALRPLWHPDVVEEFGPVGVLEGAEAVAAHFTSLFAAVPDLRITPLVVACEGDHVLIHWRATGTFSGRPFDGVRATGSPIDLLGADCMTFDRGLLRHNVVTYDGALFARQIGMLPAAGSVADRVLTVAFNLRTVALGLLKR